MIRTSWPANRQAEIVRAGCTAAEDIQGDGDRQPVGLPARKPAVVQLSVALEVTVIASRRLRVPILMQAVLIIGLMAAVPEAAGMRPAQPRASGPEPTPMATQ